MKRPTVFLWLALILFPFNAVISILWFREAHSVGIGYISKNLAPFGIASGFLCGLFLIVDGVIRVRRARRESRAARKP